MSASDAPNVVARQLQFVLRWILKCVEDLDEQQLRWQPGVTAPSIRFHLFHIARCADITRRIITEEAEQVWTREGIAARWGLVPEKFGIGEHGATIDDADAMHLALPEKQELMTYAERILTATESALAHVDDERFQVVVPGYGGEPMTVGEVITDQLEHLGRHLGMIEAMRGVQGLRGTATI